MLGVEVVLVSPLARTLETATGLFVAPCKLVALEALRERVHESCNLRQPTEILHQRFSLYISHVRHFVCVCVCVCTLTSDLCVCVCACAGALCQVSGSRHVTDKKRSGQVLGSLRTEGLLA